MRLQCFSVTTRGQSCLNILIIAVDFSSDGGSTHIFYFCKSKQQYYAAVPILTLQLKISCSKSKEQKYDQQNVLKVTEVKVLIGQSSPFDSVTAICNVIFRILLLLHGHMSSILVAVEQIFTTLLLVMYHTLRCSYVFYGNHNLHRDQSQQFSDKMQWSTKSYTSL